MSEPQPPTLRPCGTSIAEASPMTAATGPPRRWPPEIPDAVWAPLAAAVLMVTAGVLGVLADQPWLFPSLGPTAFLQAEAPAQRMSRFTNTVLGHMTGLAAGYLALAVLGAESSSSVLATGHLSFVRMWASAVAIAVTILIGILWRVSHPPASATTLLVTLGGFRPTVHDALAVCTGVIIVGGVGEVLRRLRLGHVIAHWGDLRPPSAS